MTESAFPGRRRFVQSGALLATPWLGALPAGLYLVRVRAGADTAVRPLPVTR